MSNHVEAVVVLAGSAMVAAVGPDPGSPSFVPFAGAIGGFAGALLGWIYGRRLDDAKDGAFIGGLSLTGAGLLTYVFGLVTNLY